MDSLPCAPSPANRPIFRFTGAEVLSASSIPTGQLALAGPSEKLDAPHWPVRGDLAHIRLAGKVFVPHYAAPMPRGIVAAGANLMTSTKGDADLREALAGGTLFNVLDMAGDWAWGQVGEDGFVGYVPLTALEERRS